MPRIPLARALGSPRPLVGMVHLPRVASVDDVEPAMALARRDAKALAEGGVDAVLVENYGDAPFAKTVREHTLAALAAAARVAREASGLPVGVNALRNDTRAALAAAVVAGGSFVRTNVLVGVMATDQGLIEGDPAGVAEYRRALRAEDRVALLADVWVKHATPWPGSTVEDAARDTWGRGGADALLVTGAATGREADAERAKRVRDAAPDAPILVASGFTAENAPAWASRVDGAIVGTAVKAGGKVEAPVDVERVRRLVAAWRAAVGASR